MKSRGIAIIAGAAALCGSALLVNTPALAAGGGNGHRHQQLSISVSTHPQVILANGSATTSISVKLRHGKARVAAAVLISETASTSGSCGTPSATSGATGRSGRLVVAYTASSVVGFCTIVASSGSLSASVTIDQIDTALSAAGTHYSLTAQAVPSSVKANGSSTSQVTLTVLNGAAPVAGDSVNGVERALQHGACGTLSAAGSTTSSGKFLFTYTATSTKGNCLVRFSEAATGASAVAVVHQSAH